MCCNLTDCRYLTLQRTPGSIAVFGRSLAVRIKGEFEGLGLGLFIAKRFAQLMGGDIVVVSESARGSTFPVTLPIASDHGHPATDSNTRQLAAAR